MKSSQVQHLGLNFLKVRTTGFVSGFLGSTEPSLLGLF